MKEILGKKVEVHIDRPLGSKHPKYGNIYPINYGYIPKTQAGDGEEIDAYVVGEFDPINTFKGTVIAVIHRNDDNEDKLVVSKETNKYNKDHIYALTEFQERYFDSEIIMLSE